jgi:hypothetical protein
VERSLARQLSNANRVGASNAKEMQPARDSDDSDSEIVVARGRGPVQQSVPRPPNTSSESDGGVDISKYLAGGKNVIDNGEVFVIIVLTFCRRGNRGSSGRAVGRLRTN